MIPNLVQADFMTCEANIEGKWVKARPLRSNYFLNKYRYAWGVFTGKYDAIQYHKQ